MEPQQLWLHSFVEFHSDRTDPMVFLPKCATPRFWKWGGGQILRAKRAEHFLTPNFWSVADKILLRYSYVSLIRCSWLTMMLIVYICELWIIPKLCPLSPLPLKVGVMSPSSYGSAAHALRYASVAIGQHLCVEVIMYSENHYCSTLYENESETGWPGVVSGHAMHWHCSMFNDFLCPLITRVVTDTRYSLLLLVDSLPTRQRRLQPSVDEMAGVP